MIGYIDYNNSYLYYIKYYLNSFKKKINYNYIII